MQIDEKDIIAARYKPKKEPIIKKEVSEAKRLENKRKYPNLISLKPKGDPRSDALRARQKGSSSDKRKLAQQLNVLTRTGPNAITPENLEKRALQLATDPKASAVAIMRMVQLINDNEDLTIGLRIQLLRAMNDAHRTIHGTKQKIEAKIESVTVTIHEPKEIPKEVINID